MAFKKYKDKTLNKDIVLNLSLIVEYSPVKFPKTSIIENPLVSMISGREYILDIKYTDFENDPDVKPTL